VDPGVSALDYVRRLELREVLEPQARRLDLSVPELPGLDYLVGLTDGGADLPDRILKSDVGDGRGQKAPHEIQGILLRSLASRPPTSTTHSEIGAGRVRNQQIVVRARIEYPKRVGHMVARRIRFGRQQIARPRIVATSQERIPDHARELASNQYPESPAHLACRRNELATEMAK
jgi:hypothetical protein